MEAMQEDADDPIKYGKDIRWRSQHLEWMKEERYYLHKYVHKMLCIMCNYAVGSGHKPLSKVCDTLNSSSGKGHHSGYEGSIGLHSGAEVHTTPCPVGKGPKILNL